MRSPFIIYSFLIILLATSCGRQDAGTVIVPTVPGRGQGGVGVITVLAQHNGKIIDTATIYIKYGSSTAVTISGYDDSVKTALNGQPATASFDSLRNGNYYIYCSGLNADTVLGGTRPPVSGGVSVSIVKQSTTPINVVLPVNE
jgi:hypothetical protein